MSPSETQKPRTHHIILPECASSFRSHAGCPAVLGNEKSSRRLVCACEACHGDAAVPEAVCISCGDSIPYQVNEYPIHQGMFIERHQVRACESCQAEFIAAELPALHATLQAQEVRP